MTDNDHFKCWYLEALSDGKLTMQIRLIVRSPEVKRSPIFEFFEILLYNAFSPPSKAMDKHSWKHFTP